MAKRDIVDQKARDTIPGSGLGKVVNEQAWGAAKAVERYGGGTQTYLPPADRHAPQNRENQQAANYHNDVPENSWLRGGGENGAEGKPNFDHRGNPNRGRR